MNHEIDLVLTIFIQRYKFITTTDFDSENMTLIIVAPKIAPFTFGNDPYEAGQFISLSCSVTQGDIPLNISWLFNNKILNSSNEITITKAGKRTSTLLIESVSGRHAGIFSCIGENDAGKDIHSSELLVNGLFSPDHICMILTSLGDIFSFIFFPC